MIKAFLKFLGGEPGEEKPMLMLLAKGFFMGIFLASYQIGAEEFFVSSTSDLDEEVKQNYIVYSLFLTGFFGIITTSLFVALQRRIKFAALVVANLLIVFLFVLFFRVFYESLSTYTFFGELPLLPFFLFVLIGPITAITLLGFWGVFGRIFNLKQSKRIIGGIDTGQLTATILAFFSIPFLTNLNLLDNNYDLLTMAVIACLGMVITTILIVRSFNLDKQNKDKKERKENSVGYGAIFLNPYMRMMALFIIVSTGAAVFTEYTFITSITTMYESNEAQLRNFLSLFNGTIMIFSFIIQSFLNDWIINNYGLRIALIIMPVVLIMFISAAIVAGHIYGYEEKTADYIYFFLFTSVGKLFTASVKDALENPAFKMFFLPLDIKIRFDVQTRIEGVISETATLLAGAIQIGLAALAFVEIIHFSYCIIFLAALMIYLAGRLFWQYRITLKNTLEIQKANFKDQTVRTEINVINALKAEALSNKPEEVVNALVLLEKIDPIQLEAVLISALQSDKKRVRSYAYRKINELLCVNKLDDLKEEVKYEDNPRLMSLAEKVVNNLQRAAAYDLKPSTIRRLSRTHNAADRILAARMLTNLTQERLVPHLLELTRDINPEVRTAALVAGGKLRRPEFWAIFVENLHLATYGNIAMACLVEAGEPALPQIDAAFYRSNQHQITMLRIIQVIGRIGGYRATELLWKKIDYPDKQIVSEILQTLGYLEFKAKEYQAGRIKLFLNNFIRNITWNLKALEEIPRDTPTDKLLRKAMIEENQQNYDDIYMLLSMLYDSQSIQLIKENIDLDTSDSVAFAIEMLDLVVEDELKSRLFAIMDDAKTEDKLERLHLHYAPESFLNYQDLLLQILNRDYNFTNRWTKAIAVYNLRYIDSEMIPIQLIANIFNPDIFILETVFSTIYHRNPEEYYEQVKRLGPGLRAEMDRAIIPPAFKEDSENYFKRQLLPDRALFLLDTPYFSGLSGTIIMQIAKQCDEILLESGVNIIEEGDPGNTPMYIIVDGEVEITDEDDNKKTVGKGDILGEKLLLATDKFDFTATVTRTSKMLLLRKEELLDSLTIHKDLVFKYLDIMNENYKNSDSEEEVDFSIFG